MKNRDTAGYSGTPLARKLGIKEASVVFLLDAPEEYRKLLEPLPADVSFVKQPDSDVDVAHIFVTQAGELLKRLRSLRMKLRSDATLWISWPKKTSKVPTSVTEDVIRKLALPIGFVDIKVCAVSEVWSGLKLVVRKELR